MARCGSWLSYSHATRSRCASIFRHAVEMLYTIKDEHPESVKTYLTPIFAEWNDAFLAILNKRTTEPPEIEVAEWGLKAEILKCINMSTTGFPKLTAPYVMPVLSGVWQDVVQLRPRYLRESVNSNPESAWNTYQDSDGDNIGFESLLFVQFEFIQTACRRVKLTKNAFVGEDGQSGIIHELTWSALNYMQMTDEQAESWKADPNQFIADEEDDSCSFNVRIAALDILLTLVDNYDSRTLQTLSLSVNQVMTDSLNDKANGNPSWWKAQESSLLAVGLMSEDICDAIKHGEPSPINVAALFDHVVLANLSAHDIPFLQGRSFIFASQFAPILPSNLAAQYVSAAVEAILNAQSAVVKVSALKALNNFNHHLDKQYLAPHQRAILQGIAPLIEVTTEETLTLIFRTLSTTSKIDEKITAEYESTLGHLVMECWTKYPAEHAMAPTVMDFFENLASNPYMNPALSARALPVLLNMITVEYPDRPMMAAAIDLLAALIRGGPSPLPSGYVPEVFPRLMSVLMTLEDRDILQSGQECLKVFIQKDLQQVVDWREPSSGKSGLELLLQFIARLLDPTQSESAALFVGDLISKLIKKGGDLISPILPELLNAVAVRLADAKLPSFIQYEIVINFLSGLTIHGRSGLEVVLSSWLVNHSDFQGLYSQKVSAVALTKVFTSADPRVAAIQVKGDMIITTSSRRVTRSKARNAPNQYAVTTVPVKIIKLLCTDLTNKIEEEYAGELDSEEDEEDTDDEGDEEDDEEQGQAEEERNVQTHGQNSKESIRDQYAFLSDYLEAQGGGPLDYFDAMEDEADVMDPDVLSDPIYQLEMKEFLVNFFQQCIQQNSPAFAECVAELSEVQKQTLAALLEN
ncbi:hypothetical protein BGZ83_008754 [Gryganskiella cystojenkinii]|nr:hypothetical protein BGZ83_008754 [Gryganskiella cystojenkinii]